MVLTLGWLMLGSKGARESSRGKVLVCALLCVGNVCVGWATRSVRLLGGNYKVVLSEGI